MGKKPDLSEFDKLIIPYLYQVKNLSSNKIAKDLGISRASVYRYKYSRIGLSKARQENKRINRTLSAAEKVAMNVRENVDSLDNKRETLFKRVIDQCKSKLSLRFDEDDRKYDLDIIRNYIRNYSTRELKINFKDLLEYKEEDPDDILAEIAEIVYNKLSR